MGIFTKDCKPTEHCEDLVHRPKEAFKTEQVTVTALPRALKAEYTVELAQETLAMHGAGSPKWVRWLAKIFPWIKVELSVDEELAMILAEEVRKEIDAEVLAQLKELPPIEYKTIRVPRHRVFLNRHWHWGTAQRILETHRCYGFIRWYTSYPLKRVPVE